MEKIRFKKNLNNIFLSELNLKRVIPYSCREGLILRFRDWGMRDWGWDLGLGFNWGLCHCAAQCSLVQIFKCSIFKCSAVQ